MRRALALGIVVTALLAGPSAATALPPPAYTPPVEAPVVDPFRPPSRPYGAGNRGLEYGTAPGDPVAAAGGGTVTFAGLVAGSRHVTVLHADGLRTSYSFLDRVGVVVGQRVARGQIVGSTVGRLHFGVRLGDAYLDPASLFSPQAARVRLVPFDEPPGSGPRGERSAISQLIGGVGRLAGQALRTTAHNLYRVGPGSLVYLADTSVGAWRAARRASDRPCTPSSTPPAKPPRGRRVAVLVAGLGSSSTNGAIDDVRVAELGYHETDVLRFSYRGGSTRDHPYESADTQVDLRASGARLADLIERVASGSPDAVVDVLAHSQGGLVTRLAVAELERRHGQAWLHRLGIVATLGTPHGGADLATAVFTITIPPGTGELINRIGKVGGLDLTPSSPAIRQLSETSELIGQLGRTPWPPNVRAVSIAAEGDIVVPVPRTAVAGVPQVVVPVRSPTAHDALPGSDSAHRELALALAGQPPTCVSFAGALRGQLTGAAISWVEDAVGTVAGASSPL